MNQLIHSFSPYLLQHAHQPVNWLPWESASIEKARLEDKLIVLSIGYSTCHWCHVMAHETFDDECVAEFMNEHFVSIKVDREERPDVDHIYMEAVQWMTGRGGWPLNCVLLPDGRPIWGGTYFNKEKWLESLGQLLKAYQNSPEEVMDYAKQLQDGILSQSLISTANEEKKIDIELFHVIRHQWSRRWDLVEGGPNRSPKFPMPVQYNYLLRYGSLFEDQKVLDYVDHTLQRMFLGGLYDHVGGGFARYSTDMKWRIPHFEKMLYDNGQLLELYAHSFKWKQHKEYAHLIYQTIDFIDRELKSPEGLYFSALDADTEGEEGKYYVWNDDEVKATLGENYNAFEVISDWHQRGYWENQKHVVLLNPTAEVSLETWKPWMQQLFQIRKSRTPPAIDKKRIASWNAMVLIGLIESSLALQDENIKKKALIHGQVFIEKFIYNDKIWHVLNENEGYVDGFLDDYAFAIRAMIYLNRISAMPVHLELAHKLCSSALNLFANPNNKLLYYNEVKEVSLHRTTESEDSVIPSSNAIMARNLIQLGRLFGNLDWEKRGNQMVEGMLEKIESHPDFHAEWAQAALDMLGPFREIVLIGTHASTHAFELGKHYLPQTVIISANTPSTLLPFENRWNESETLIYVCEERSCQLPVTSLEAALQLIPKHIES